MEALSIISAIISLVILIIFCYMAANVSQIKKFVTERDKEKFRVQYHKYRVLGDNAQAREALLSLIFTDLLYHPYTSKERKYLFDMHKLQCEQSFKELGYEFPEYPF